MSALTEYRIPLSVFNTNGLMVYQQNLNCTGQSSPCFQHRGVMGIFCENKGKFGGITVAHLFSTQPENYCLVDRNSNPLVFFKHRCSDVEMNKDFTFVVIGEIDQTTKEVIVKTNNTFPKTIHFHKAQS